MAGTLHCTRTMAGVKRALLFALLIVSFGPGHAQQEDPPAMPELIIIGASYAADWGTPDLAGFSVTNRGIGGQETPDVRARFAQDVLNKNPDVTLIWGFINDIFRAPDGAMEQRRERIRENLAAMTESARGQGVRPILATEIPIRHKAGLMSSVEHFIGSMLGKRSYQDWINSHVHAVNDWLRGYAEDNGILLLDFARTVSDEEGYRLARSAQDDGSHVSEAGYGMLTEYTNARIDAWRDAGLLE